MDPDDTLNSSMANYLGYDLLKDEDVLKALESVKDILRGAGIEEEQVRDRIVSRIVIAAEDI